MQLKTCAECFYFQTFGSEAEKMGECYRKPPTVFLMPQQVRTALDPTPKIQMQRVTAYPVIHNENRQCGDFEIYKTNNAVVQLAHDSQKKT